MTLGHTDERARERCDIHRADLGGELSEPWPERPALRDQRASPQHRSGRGALRSLVDVGRMRSGHHRAACACDANGQSSRARDVIDRDSRMPDRTSEAWTPWQRQRPASARLVHRPRIRILAGGRDREVGAHVIAANERSPVPVVHRERAPTQTISKRGVMTARGCSCANRS